jgi:1-deoxy-D-xylulose-5-phosphate reductoisomerase
MMRTLTILGATGSIGTSTLDLVQRNRHLFEISALSAYDDYAGLAKAAVETQAKLAVIGNDVHYQDLKSALSGTGIEVASGPKALEEAAARGADVTMAAIVGCAGLAPTMAALKTGKTVALANKEALVSAGDLMINIARQSQATLLPTDSEHNAIFQCLDRSAPKGVAKLILTASGGPFRTFSHADMANVTPEQALKHPNWSMGAKITIDSATMFNKGLELIEAHYLFDMSPDRIDVLFHPQSVIHSLVEYVDGSVLAQLGAPDMRIPIAHCLAWPERMNTPVERLDLAQIARLDFEAPDPVRFPALRLARAAAEQGGARPAILNAANEVAVQAFLKKAIRFTQIAHVVEFALNSYAPEPPQSIDDVLTIDKESRRIAKARVEALTE